MPPTTSWKRFAEEVEIGLGLGVVRVEFSKEDFCLFALDGLIFTKRWLSAADKHISEKSKKSL